MPGKSLKTRASVTDELSGKMRGSWHGGTSGACHFKTIRTSKIQRVAHVELETRQNLVSGDLQIV